VELSDGKSYKFLSTSTDVFALLVLLSLSCVTNVNHRQPHWTLLCIPADDTHDSTSNLGTSPSLQEPRGSTTADLDFSQAHLHLCLNLSLPLVIVITKYDLATKAGLRQTLSKLLSALKEAGRKPCIVSDSSTSAQEPDLQSISMADLDEARGIVESLTTSPLTTVPIILTSAVRGTGMNKLHAFLRELPIPQRSDNPFKSAPDHLFYIEDIYSAQTRASSDQSAIVGGYLRYGTVNVGDELLLGPYPVDMSSDDSDSGSGRVSVGTPTILQSRSFPGAFRKPHTRNSSLQDHRSEWRRVRITSLRNLRLPVRTLYPDQVGTMGIAPVNIPILSPAINRIRKGMVLADRPCKASKVITVRFEDSQTRAAQGLSIGSAVVVYIASVRASSKVISVTTEPSTVGDTDSHNEDEDSFGFGFDDEPDESSRSDGLAAALVTFQFIGSGEFVEHGAKVLVMPGGGPGLSGGNERGAKGLAGLEGFVGRVVDE
jgi:hypothetical protein